MMTVWKGLWKKEWLMMKDWLYATAVMAVLLVIVVAAGLSFLVEGKLEMSFMLGISLMMWILIAVCVPVTLLLNSLSSEWKRPDVWLHSPQSVYQLFGSKVLFAVVMGLIIMLVPGTTLAVYASVTEAFIGGSGVAEFIRMIYAFTSSLFLGAAGFMLVGLFLAVVYRMIKSYARRGTIFIWLGVLFVSMWLLQFILKSELYQKLAHLGQLPGAFNSKNIQVGNFYYALNFETLYAGQILLVIVFLAFLFFSSAWLFERKVRL
ncbi:MULTISPECIES: hypothetical protein [unclassified Sporosarcina]|uniref:hypothetical protein n=1 Tax=unclassified Sporosarcina TaxID=2647733 RepID=UPI00203E3DB5|nr:MULTISPECIES: hypothetical protein [unclassified Sporosarcina]GKV63851.1 hypothetical protein NCCP2331_00040 [Sporosarcina sp. NCCP-2331]GLB54630.1 hypothetical protein NCCP2378_04150 [Sporosarcina sp. NCCP-2378]